jgi:hypothetical protein
MNKIRFGLGVVLLSACACVHAEKWKIVGYDEKSKLFIDMDSLKTIDGYNRAWFMRSYKKAVTIEGYSYKSYLKLVEADCKNGRSRTYSTSTTSGPMGSGKTVLSGDDQDPPWSYAVPGSGGEFALDTLCK